MSTHTRFFKGVTLRDYPNYKACRKFVKHIVSQKPARELVSLLDEARCHYEDNGEYFTEYGFLPERMNDWDDEMIQEEVDDLREYICSPYDCTGQRFTMWITWHRNPCGRISVVHRFGIDV